MNTFPLVRDMTAEIELLVAEKRRVEYGIQVNIFLVRLKGQCHEHVLQFIIFGVALCLSTGPRTGHTFWRSSVKELPGLARHFGMYL